jgi:hypothetical protein
MKNEQIILCVVQAKRQQLATDAAVLVEIDKNGPKYLGFGKQGAAAHERPVVVLLQGRDAGSAPGRIVATTTPPDESEIGMAWKYGIDRIIFWDGAAGKQINITNDGAKFVPQDLRLTAELQLWNPPLKPATFPTPLNDTAAKNWLAALNKAPDKGPNLPGNLTRRANARRKPSPRKPSPAGLPCGIFSTAGWMACRRLASRNRLSRTWCSCIWPSRWCRPAGEAATRNTAMVATTSAASWSTPLRKSSPGV